MANEVLIYSPIYDFTAESFIKSLNEMDGSDVTVRVNSPGGDVFAGWGMIAKSKEHEGNITVKVDGNASSMMAIFLLFHKNVEALNVSKFTLHRASAAYPSPESDKLLKQINGEIRTAFEAKLNIEKFEKMTGVTMDDFFNSSEVIDVDLNAKQAKQIGLISKINEIDVNAFNDLSIRIAAISTKQTNKNPKKDNKMTLAQLKADHPEVYAQAVKQGVEQEIDRVGSWLAFGDVDFQAVSTGIKEGKELSKTAMAEMSKKQFAAEAVATAAVESAPVVVTPAVPTSEPDAKEAFLAEVRQLKIK